jgi:NADH dehydrogenase (ubiquinone) 1 alpha subcomplex subunit 10
MAGVFRVGIISFINHGSKPLMKTTLPTLTQACNISGKTLRGSAPRPAKPAPYPYTEKGYGFLNAVMDKTTKRMDENSKVFFDWISPEFQFIIP